MPRAVIGAAAATLILFAWTGAVFAADDIPTVEVSGIVLDTEGQPAEVESAVLTQSETAGGEGTSTAFEVNPDGTFTVALLEWGTPEMPAQARLSAFGVSEVVIDDDGCTIASNHAGSVTLMIPGQVPTEPIVIVLDEFVSSAVCPGPVPPDEDPRAPAVTLPPTDTQARGPVLTASVGAALLLAGIALLGAGFTLARRGSRPH
jgi:hypothetical protein